MFINDQCDLTDLDPSFFIWGVWVSVLEVIFTRSEDYTNDAVRMACGV
jgi:hypothetical protein